MAGFCTSDYECSPAGPDARMRLAPPPMDFFDCFLRGTSTHRPGPHHGPRSATELSSRREDVLSTSRPAVHGICDRRGRFDRRMHNKLTRDDVHCASCRDRPKLRERTLDGPRKRPTAAVTVRVQRTLPLIGGVAGRGSGAVPWTCLLYTSPSPRDRTRSRMPSSA